MIEHPLKLSVETRTIMYKICKTKPLPERSNRGRKMKFPFEHMEIGDSFLIPKLTRSVQSSVSASGLRWSKLHANGKVKFLTHREETGYRVYRIK